jgi:hypothetical protein
MAIEVGELYDCLAGRRAERVAHERQISLLIFSSWLHCSLDPVTELDAQTTASALIVVALSKGILTPVHSVDQDISAIVEKYMPPSIAAALIISKDQDRIGFSLEQESHLYEMNIAEAQASFLLQLPSEMKPSLNKAHFFLDSRGYDRPSVDKAHDYYDRASPTTSKQAWTRYSHISPFLLAARLCGLSDIQFLPPDDLSSVEGCKQFSPEKMQQLFGMAITIQKQLNRRLSRTGAKRLKFPKLPADIVGYQISLPRFTVAQLELVTKYRAPKAL